MRQGRSNRRTEEMIWDAAIIGRGSAAALSSATIGLAKDFVIAIGLDDPWSSTTDGSPDGRGHPTDKNDPTYSMNQTGNLLHGFGIESVDTKGAPLARAALADQNHEMLEKFTKYQLKRKVTNVSFGMVQGQLNPDNKVTEQAFIVQYDAKDKPGVSRNLYARRIVMALGAGTSRFPAEFVQLTGGQLNDFPRVIDVNAFAKLNQKDLLGKTVIVLGPNAAIDAVQKGLFKPYKCQVHWLVQAGAQESPLPSQKSVHEAKKDILSRFEGKLAVSKTGNGLKIQFKRADPPKSKWSLGTTSTVPISKAQIAMMEKNKQVEIAGDYFVYGLGQTGETTTIIDPSILKMLEPIYDTNQVLGKPQDSIFGYRSKDHGDKFRVFGAMSAQVARELLAPSNKELKNVKQKIEDMRKLIEQKHAPKQLLHGKLAQIFEDLDELVKLDLRVLESIFNTQHGFLKFKNDLTSAGYAKELAGHIIKYCELKKYIDSTKLTTANALNNPAKSLSSQFTDSGQYGTIRTVIAAANNYIPLQQSIDPQKYIYADGSTTAISGSGDFPTNKMVNFSTYDRNQLAAFITVNYPYIWKEAADEFVAEVIAGRGPRQEYSEGEVRKLRGALELLNRLGQSRWA